jgi:hypothetical protein
MIKNGTGKGRAVLRGKSKANLIEVSAARYLVRAAAAL